MDGVYVDLSTVFIAAVLNMVIGFFWYSKWLFGDKRNQPSNKSVTSKLAPFLTFIVSLVIAYFLAFFETYVGVTTVSDGMFVGFCLWLGFVATTQFLSVLWDGQPLKQFLIHSGCKLLSFLAMSGVIGA